MAMSGESEEAVSWHVRHRSLNKDRAGQVSFAVIAVVLVVATGLTGTYLAKKTLDEAEEEKRQRLLDAMELRVEQVSSELELCAATRAQETVSGWEEFPVNQSKISDAFNERMVSYISETFPRDEDRFEVCVENWTGGLFFVERKTVDLVPSDETSTEQFEDNGSTMEYEDLDYPSADVLDERTVTAYYLATGNFTASVSTLDVELCRAVSIQKPIISALPFLESKLRAFESASTGEFSDLGRLVEYMVSTLGQLRVLEGYGLSVGSEGAGSDDIVTELDVYRAVSVGLLLEQARLFRTLDANFTREVAHACGGGSPGVDALVSSKGRELDPAELFLWFLGKTVPEVDSRLIIAQAVFGMSDQVIVKIMEYAGWLGTLELVDGVVERVGDTVDSFISWLTGEDKAHESVVSWIKRAAETAGENPDSFAYVFTSDGDLSLPVPERVYFVEDLAGELYPVWVGNFTACIDVPVLDMMSLDFWDEFYPEFKDCQSSVKDTLYEDISRFAFALADSARLETEGFVIDPADSHDLFTSLAMSSGEVTLSFEPEGVADAARQLPVFGSQYELAERLDAFIEASSDSVTLPERAIEAIYSEIAASVLANAVYPHIPDLIVPVEQQLEEIVLNDVACDAEWGLTGIVDTLLRMSLEFNMERIAGLVKSSVLMTDQGLAGPLVEMLACAVAYGSDEFPSFGRVLEDSLAGLSRAVLAQRDLSAHKQKCFLDTRGVFEFWEGDWATACEDGGVVSETLSFEVPGGLPAMEAVPYDAAKGYTSLERMFPTDRMLVQVRRPWQFDDGVSEYPNSHLTSLGDTSATPYATQWTVSAVGMVEISLRSQNSIVDSLLLSEVCDSSSAVRIDICVPVVLHSAWPLHGVTYNPTNTMIGDTIAAAKRFCEIVWDKLGPVVSWFKDGFESAFRFMGEVFETVASFATRVVIAVSKILQTLVETLQSYIQKMADSALGKAVKVFIDLVGRVELRITLHGFTIIIQTYLPDLIYRQGSDLLRVIVCTDRFGPGISFGVRVARLSDGSYDILGNATLRLKGFTAEVMVDPLMHILRRFVEVHCRGGSWGLDIMVPEVEPYELAEVGTGDLPGAGALLSNIPLPALGLSASVEAGLKLKYSPPFPTDIVVNEFESNPPGEDSGNEWVELYNPLDEPRCVDGWSIGTLHGRSSEMQISGVIAPNGLKVFRFPETSIDNGYVGDPFNDGDSVILRDQTGRRVDTTPIMRDTHNDLRSLQRTWDGGPKWVLRQSSEGRSNGAPVMLATSDFIAKSLFEAFREAFEQTKLEEVTASLDFLVLLSKRVLNNFIENMLSLVGEVIHEIIFYLKVTLADATGSAGFGFRASFIVTGESIVELLRWLIHSFATFIVNLGRASCPMAYPVFPQGFFAGLYLRFEALFEVGLPRMIKLLGAATMLDQKFVAAACVSPNMPAIGRLVGRNWGNWSVDFGLYLEGVPKEFVNGAYLKETGDKVDFWVVKARLFGT